MAAARDLKILIVEDETFIGMCVGKMLAREGFTVQRIVSTGEEAIASARKEPPSLILMDVMLAGDLDGAQTAEAIRVAAGDIPIIFMTGYPREVVMKRLKNVTPSGFLLKPFDPTDLVNAILAVFPDVTTRTHVR